jgi:septal ring factor EnvC (AmiA/AmiB activator)
VLALEMRVDRLVKALELHERSARDMRATIEEQRATIEQQRSTIDQTVRLVHDMRASLDRAVSEIMDWQNRAANQDARLSSILTWCAQVAAECKCHLLVSMCRTIV